MQILTVDIGTGTQDFYLFQSGVALENGFKMVAPSPTMVVSRKIRAATSRGEDLLLTGVTMGGGPITWAADAHLQAGYKIFATPDAARTFNDDLELVRRKMGVEIVSRDEAESLDAHRLELKDFDYPTILEAFSVLGVQIDPQAVAVGVFDHGAAPPDVSDRQFRFDYLKARIQAKNRLSAFAYPAADLPPFLTRMHAVVQSAANPDCPLIVMDTAPAAVLGALLDPHVRSLRRVLIANIGNLHTLAFRMESASIEGVFEHHTGLIDRTRLEAHLIAFAEGTIKHEDVFAEHGHGALILQPEPLSLKGGLAVTGPRRDLLRGSILNPQYAVPFGDMMLSGCFGLLSACADLLPDLAEPIHGAMRGDFSHISPWDVDP
ncbi:MAG TPA: DUF1786 domain-containing protein [Anaerolineae bacterium]|nr:DUF1786 domain-containing protein [Anaerolineae bacterium]